MRAILAMVVLLGVAVEGQAAMVVKKTVTPARARVELLENGKLDAVKGDAFVKWGPYGQGYAVDSEVKRSGGFSGRCRSDGPGESRGMVYQVELNQKLAAPIVAECWSKAEGASFGSPSDYALYLDLLYEDGTPLWGQIAAFDAGTHGWQKGTVTIAPAKPIKSLSLFGLFRNRTGTVWFDDFSLRTLAVPETADQFDGIVVEGSYHTKERAMTAPIVVQQGKLALSQAGGQGSVFVRDVAAGSDFVQLGGKLTPGPEGFYQYEASDEKMQLALSATYRMVGEAVRVDGTLRDLSGKDRAISVYFSYPVEAVGWRWYQDQRVSQRIEAGKKYHNLVQTGAGANGLASRYPLACVASDSDSLAIAAPLDVPRLCRLGYDAGSKELYAAVDLGLSSVTEQFPSSASFSLLLYRPEPAWGFRSALEQYYRLNPQSFTKRNTKEGIWMPFTRISSVAGFEDFGFQFKEGNQEVPFDAAHGISSFVYVEPWSYWLSMPPEAERTPAKALEMVAEEAKEGKPAAQATVSSVMEREDGTPCVRMENQPWCNGAVFGISPSPGVKAPGGLSQFQRLEQTIEEAFARDPQLAGVYHDSFEMYLFHNQLDYRREHFGGAGIPLVFDQQGRVCQYAMFDMVEFAKAVADRMWPQGKMTFANSTPHQFPWGAAYLDVMGTETNWASDDRYRPDEASTLDYWRAICDQRPFLLLLNTDFNRFRPEWVEQYMKRAAAWGLFPSMFSFNASEDPYWQNADLYNRDRPLFKKYIPVISAISAAGWEAVTRARSSNPEVYVERFGKPGGAMYFTVFNDGAARQEAEIVFEAGALGMSGEAVRLKDALTGRAMTATVSDGVARLAVTLEAQDVMVWEGTAESRE